MNQNIKTYYVPKSQQARRDLNKRLKEEQEPSMKNTIKRLAKGAAKVAGTVHKVATKKLNNFVADEKRINRIERDIFGDMDEGFKKMGPSAKGTWVNPVVVTPVVKKKKKSKKAK